MVCTLDFFCSFQYDNLLNKNFMKENAAKRELNSANMKGGNHGTFISGGTY
jgi:hypothetical protein